MENATKTQYTSLLIGGKEKANYFTAILGETEKAFKVEIMNTYNGLGACRTEWFPKSQVKLVNDNDSVYLDVTPWIAMQKSILPD
jgi:fucose permease